MHWSSYLTTFLFYAMAGTLLVRARRLEMLGRYRWFYGYVAWSLLRSTGNWLVIFWFGYRSWAYYWSYHTGEYLTPFLEVCVLADLYGKVKCRSDRSHWWALPGIVVVVLALRSATGAGFYATYLSLVLFFELALCLMIWAQWLSNAEIELGRNNRGIFYGFLLQAGTQGLFFFGMLLTILPSEVIWILTQPLALLPWFIYLYSFRRLEPLRRVQPEFRPLEESSHSTIRSILPVFK